MLRKRPFAKKTANMKIFGAKLWAEYLKDIYKLLINFANASREIKQLLKEYDAASDYTKKDKYVKKINAKRELLKDDLSDLKFHLNQGFDLVFDENKDIAFDTNARLNFVPDKEDEAQGTSN